jgi:3-oxoacyl-[acyl-carrier-protein] synthase-3
MGIGIRSLGVCIPERRLGNEELAKSIDTTDEWIVSHTGIRNRHIGSPEEATSDLAVKACLEALRSVDFEPERIDMIIAATATGDYPGFPAVACMVQDRLKAKRAAAFDLNAGCTGFVYGMEIARGMIASGAAKAILVVGAEMLSRITDWTDRDTCVLFGDGAGAALITELEGNSGILKSILRADGRGADYLKRTAGGSRFPYREGITKARDFAISMDGRKVYNFAVGANCDLLERYRVDRAPSGERAYHPGRGEAPFNTRGEILHQHRRVREHLCRVDSDRVARNGGEGSPQEGRPRHHDRLRGRTDIRLQSHPMVIYCTTEGAEEP